MSESPEQSVSSPSVPVKSPSSTPEPSGIEIDLQNVSDTQKIAIISILVTFVIQIIYLFNMHILTDFFKGMISVASYKPIGDYVSNFISAFVPYLVVVFLCFAFYSAYVVLVNDSDHLKFLNTIYLYLVVSLVVDFILFFMSVSTSDPYTTEFFLFLFVIIIMMLIAWIPFGIYDLLEKRTTQ